MEKSQAIERLAAARRHLSLTAAHLEAPSPQALEETASRLESVVRELASPAAWLAADARSPQALDSARLLRAELLRSRRLLEAAVAYFAHWTRRRGAITGGYTREGQPAPVHRPGRLSLEA